MDTIKGKIISKLSTGIMGLDDMCDGGIPIKNHILLYGPSGTGKTLMSFEMLYKSAKINIPSTFISLEETRESVIEDIQETFPYFDDILDFIDSKKIIIEDKDSENVLKSPENWQSFLAEINRMILSNKSQIVVIDSITPLRTFANDDRKFTIATNSIVKNFKNLNVTSITTLQTPLRKSSVDNAGLYGSYMFDGVISLNLEEVSGSTQYIIEIVKMRGSPHKISPKPYELTSKGYNVFR